MKIQPHDSPLRWLVESSRGGDHMVDVGANRGFGACACEHHTLKIQPALDAGHAVPIAHRCRHIVAARARLLDEVIAKLSTEGAADGT